MERTGAALVIAAAIASACQPAAGTPGAGRPEATGSAPAARVTRSDPPSDKTMREAATPSSPAKSTEPLVAAVVTDKTGQAKTLGWTLHWTRSLATAKHKNGQRRVLYDFRRADEKCKQQCQALRHCGVWSAEGWVVSIVGTYVSIERNEAGDCGGAHPYAWHTVRTMDLARPKHKVRLKDFLSRAQLQRVFASNQRVQDLLREGDGCTVDTDALEHHGRDHFFFRQLTNHRIEVVLGLSHGCEVARGSLTEIPLWFSVTKARNLFTTADQQRTLGTHLRKGLRVISEEMCPSGQCPP